MLQQLFELLIIGLGAWLCVYLIGLIDNVGPLPMVKVVLKVIVVLVALLAAFSVFGVGLGGGAPLHFG